MPTPRVTTERDYFYEALATGAPIGEQPPQNSYELWGLVEAANQLNFPSMGPCDGVSSPHHVKQIQHTNVL
jgi:hypothetical protein